MASPLISLLMGVLMLRKGTFEVSTRSVPLPCQRHIVGHEGGPPAFDFSPSPLVLSFNQGTFRPADVRGVQVLTCIARMVLAPWFKNVGGMHLRMPTHLEARFCVRCRWLALADSISSPESPYALMAQDSRGYRFPRHTAWDELKAHMPRRTLIC